MAVVSQSSRRRRTVIVLLLPGLGDALTASPLLRRLSDEAYTLDAMTMLTPVAEYAQALGIFRAVYNLPLLSRPASSLPALLRLRGKHDACVVPFPATRWQYAAVTAAISTGEVFFHDYGGLSRLLLTAGRTTFVPLRGGHRLAENDRLASAMGLSGSLVEEYLVPEAWKASREPGLIGVNTGSMIYKGNEARRWPFGRFADVIRDQAVLRKRRVRVFVGPNEEGDMARLRSAFGTAIEIVNLPLSDAARKLAQCEVFVGNDAGLAHLAAGLGVKTIALFGMTNPVRATPIGAAIALRPSECRPCHDEGMRDFRCPLNINYRCMNEDFPSSVVSGAVDAALAGPVPQFTPLQESAFRLYGRPHASQ